MDALDLDPPGWREPIARALWQRDLLFDVPRWVVYYVHPAFIGTALFSWSWTPLFSAWSWFAIYGAIATHFGIVFITQHDSEWETTVDDFSAYPDEIDP